MRMRKTERRRRMTMTKGRIEAVGTSNLPAKCNPFPSKLSSCGALLDKMYEQPARSRTLIDY